MRYYMSHLTLLLPVLSLAVAGCQSVVEVDVEGVIEKPTITIGGDSLGECVNQIVVYEEQSSGSKYAWSISSGLQCIVVRKVAYGIAPVGFRAYDGPKSLAADRAYTVRVDGPGIQGIQRFASENGVIVVKRRN